MKYLTKKLFGTLFVDKGYLSQKLFDALWEKGIKLVTKQKRMQKRKELWNCQKESY